MSSPSLMEKRGSGFQKITTHTSELRLYSKDLAPTFESDASSFFTTVYSDLYGKTDADFQRIIDQESAENEAPLETSPRTTQNLRKKILAQKLTQRLAQRLAQRHRRRQ